MISLKKEKGTEINGGAFLRVVLLILSFTYKTIIKSNKMVIKLLSFMLYIGH